MLFWNARGEIRLAPPSETPTVDAPDRQLPDWIAVHEATHAVVGLAYGCVPERVCVGAAATERGHLGFVKFMGTISENDFWQQVIIDVSGEEAEQHFYGRRPTGETPDQVHARGLLCEVLGEDRHDPDLMVQAFAQARTAALQIIKNNELAILRLARELERRQELDAFDCVAIVGRVPPGPTRSACRQALAQHIALERETAERRAREWTAHTARVAAVMAEREPATPQLAARHESAGGMTGWERSCRDRGLLVRHDGRIG
jgi:hypothetical protein